MSKTCRVIEFVLLGQLEPLFWIDSVYSSSNFLLYHFTGRKQTVPQLPVSSNSKMLHFESSFQSLFLYKISRALLQGTGSPKFSLSFSVSYYNLK